MKKIGKPDESSMQALQPVEHSTHATYTIEAVANLAQAPGPLFVLFYKHGLVVPTSNFPDGGWYFDDQAIHVLRRIEYLRTMCGMNLAGIKAILGLRQEGERCREGVRFFHRQ